MDELEIVEARYDAMPPDVARTLRHGKAGPLSNRHHTLKTEVAFARRMFRANQRARRAERRIDPATRRKYREDCRHWWHRYRKAQASAAQVGHLLALDALHKSIHRR